MQPMQQAKRALLSPQILFANSSPLLSVVCHNNNKINGDIARSLPFLCYCNFYCYYSTVSAVPIPQINLGPELAYKRAVQSFKEWFTSPNYGFKDRIFEILREQDAVDDDALRSLDLRLTESLVLEILNHGKSRGDVLSCLKFFDWAGRQFGFRHTPPTFVAILKILSKAKLMPLMLDFLDNFKKLRFVEHDFTYGYHAILVMGYSVAGKPLVALQLFGKMRFQGIDLDALTYHVLLNSLVEECCFDLVGTIARQISTRGFECHVTHSIVVKSFVKQRMLDEAEAYLRRLVLQGETGNEVAVGILVDALCGEGLFEKAQELVQELRELGVVPMENSYSMWLRNLVRRNKINEALQFIQQSKSLHGYVPNVFQYNELLCRLMRGCRLKEAGNLLFEMMETGISPNKVTMNVVFCFLCKAGMVDVAFELYNCRSEVGFSPTLVVYNYLISSLCSEGSVDEAYHVLKSATDQGYVFGRRTCSLLGDALCREGKLEMMKELVFFAAERNLRLNESTYDKFISALSRAGRVSEGYLVHGKIDGMDRVPSLTTYSNLIHGLNKFNKGDIAARLLIELQHKGHKATRPLFRLVIRSLCDMENPETQLYKFLETQLSHHQSTRHIYNCFIDGAGHANMPDIAREVFEMMQNDGIEPNRSSDILLLQSYLQSGRISNALNFFDSLHQRRRVGRKLYNCIIVGFCKIDRLDCALPMFQKIRSDGLVPSLQCYEFIIMKLCSNEIYDMAIEVLFDLQKTRRQVSTFVGNHLLYHSLKGGKLYDAWLRAKQVRNEVPPNLSLLGQIIGVCSGHLKLSQETGNLEELIALCFPLDLYTYNLVLRRISMKNIDNAFEFFYKMCQKGHAPNRWTYDILVHGLLKHGRAEEGRRWMDEMFRLGFDPTDATKKLM